MQHLAGLEVYQVHHDRRRPEVDGQPVYPAAVGVDAPAAEVYVAASALRDRVGVDVAAHRVGEDARLAPQDGELDVRVDVRHQSLAGEPVAAAQEGLGLGRRAERIHAALDLDDALVALAAPAARGGHPDAQAVGVVEDRPARDQVEGAVGVVKRRHAASLASSPRPSRS